MSCVPSSNCSFAAERFTKLEATIAFYAKLRVATERAGRAGELERRLVAEDMAHLDRKMLETVNRMHALKPCLKA